MKTIVFQSMKGGVGKTASAVSTAAILAENSRVLMVDLDPQATLTSHFCDQSQGAALRDVLKSGYDLSASILRVKKGLDLLPTALELMLLEIELFGKPNREYLLHDAFEELNDIYDYAVIDTKPDVGFLNRSALIAADIVVIPTQLEAPSAKAIYDTRRVIRDCREAARYFKKSLDEIILPTFYEENRPLHEKVLDELRKNYPELVVDIKIHRSADIARTYSQRGDFLPKNTRSYTEYSEFCGYLR